MIICGHILLNRIFHLLRVQLYGENCIQCVIRYLVLILTHILTASRPGGSPTLLWALQALAWTAPGRANAFLKPQHRKSCFLKSQHRKMVGLMVNRKDPAPHQCKSKLRSWLCSYGEGGWGRKDYFLQVLSSGDRGVVRRTEPASRALASWRCQPCLIASAEAARAPPRAGSQVLPPRIRHTLPSGRSGQVTPSPLRQDNAHLGLHCGRLVAGDILAISPLLVTPG